MDNDLEHVPDELSVVVSEEVLEVGTQTRVSGRVRLRKRVVVETVTQTVEVRREELVVERMDVDDQRPGADDAGDRIPFEDRDLELVLYAEEVLVTKRVVPVERVRLTTRTVTELADVSDTVRREHVDHWTESTSASGG